MSNGQVGNQSNINESSASKHRWSFFRAGGFDQVCLDNAADLRELAQLDQKLWVALACPARGVEFDHKTLDLIDTDKDGRIRVPEILAAVQWTCRLLKDPKRLAQGSPSLPLDAINDADDEGKQMLASARSILVNLGKANAGALSVEDTTDTARILGQMRFNGDGIVPAESTDDPEVRSVIQAIIACLGGELDRSGKLGVNQVKLDRFFSEAQAYVQWWTKAKDQADQVLPLGDATPAAAAAVQAVRVKVNDYFARCRLAAFDTRAQGALNRPESEYTALLAKDISANASEIAAFPLARIEAGKPLPLCQGVNPAWAAALASLHDQAIKPLLGPRTELSESDWIALTARFASYEAWTTSKAGASVESLGLARLQEILASKTKEAIVDLLAKDKKMETESNLITAVDRLVRYHRDLHQLLRNFVNFRDFYGRRDKAIFQAGTLYLDRRSCDLCIRVDDPAKHATLAPLSQIYLAYCDLTRKATGEKMTIAAAFTDGDSDNLMVGRNGIFYDRQGRDWDATIVRIVDNPISIRQAFWSPYKRLIRWIQEQIAKRAAAADAAQQSKMETAVTSTTAAATTPAAPGAKPAATPAPANKMDVGIIAAFSVAFAFLATAFAGLMQWVANTPKWTLPLYVLLLLLIISGPSMIIAWLKLRQRNLGPLLDANGWAVNALARINIPFGKSLTGVAVLPPNSHRNLTDPYAESKSGRYKVAAVVVVLIALWACWFFGLFEKILPNVLPKSSFVQNRQAPLPPASPAPTTPAPPTTPDAAAPKP